MKKSIYFDYAAATPIDPAVAKVVEQTQKDFFANPSSLHTPGRLAGQKLAEARARVAKILGAKPAEIIFTCGTTEAANIAISGLAAAWPQTRILASAIEHEAVLATLDHLERAGRQVGKIPVTSDGIVKIDQVLASIDDLTSLVCVQYANNEIGSIQQIAKVSQLIAGIRVNRRERGITTPLFLYCDAAQAGMLSLQVSRLGVDLMSMGGSKLYGPSGSGFLYVRAGVKLEPVITGGGQEFGLRSGTPSVALAVGLAEALERQQARRTGESKRQQVLRDHLWQKIQKIEEAVLNGTLNSRLPGNLNVTFPGASGEELVSHLDAAGFAVATGSACSASSEEPSHVLRAIGRSVPEAEASLRLTLGQPTTKAEVDSLASILVKVVGRVRQLSGK
ncbi:MAG TPA: cysteine desulfurase family protein [Candidatus Saccharimonadales bacterium]|nr:cysteine desulfurase family protein [Candidatus Saccharimonadales bacterium]